MFLATTALSEFWDKDQEILFLGSWCLRYDQQADWKGLKYQVMPSPWDDRKRFYDACRYIDACYERILGHLVDCLNATHQVSFSERYWRILIGPWLLHYLHEAYDRYVHLTDAFQYYPDLHTVVLDTRSFRVPLTTKEYIDLVHDDAFNLQMFSQQLHEMGHVFPARTLQNGWPEIRKMRAKSRWRGAVKDAVRRTLHVAGSAVCNLRRDKGYAALYSMNCSLIQMWALALRTRLQAIPHEMEKDWLFPIRGPAFDERRNRFAALPSTDEFERVAVQCLPQNFPIMYLEAYRDARDEVLRTTPRIPDVIMSAVDWWASEPFKFLTAEASDRGSRLVTVQHGGGYGQYRFFPCEKHESRVGDSFMVWGWADQKAGPCRNLPNPRLSKLLANPLDWPRSQKPRTILFVATAHLRYLHRLHSAPVGSQWEEFFAWEIRFLRAATDRLRAAILFRPYMEDYGHAIRQRISEKFSDIRWDAHQPVYQSLKSCRMVVIDHPSTTFLETLVADVPTILFWNQFRWEMRDEAEPYFDCLRNAGILWDSPEAAASQVAAVFDEPRSWWDSEAVQEARKCFVDRYALARENWLDCWAQVIQEEVALSQAKKQ